MATINNDERHLPQLPAPKPAYSVDEIAALLGLHRVTISRFINKGELRAARLGHRTVRVTHEALLDFLSSKEVMVQPQPAKRNKRGKKS